MRLKEELNVNSTQTYNVIYTKLKNKRWRKEIQAQIWAWFTNLLIEHTYFTQPRLVQKNTYLKRVHTVASDKNSKLESKIHKRYQRMINERLHLWSSCIQCSKLVRLLTMWRSKACQISAGILNDKSRLTFFSDRQCDDNIGRMEPNWRISFHIELSSRDTIDSHRCVHEAFPYKNHTRLSILRSHSGCFSRWMLQSTLLCKILTIPIEWSLTLIWYPTCSSCNLYPLLLICMLLVALAHWEVVCVFRVCLV